MDRETAKKVLEKYTENINLVKHGLAVEAVMKHFAKLHGENEEKWGIVGLLHDIDYDKYPEEHCQKCVEILEQEGFDNSTIHSVQSHGYGICSDVEPTEYMEKVLYTIDELTGLITATALMKPNKTLAEVDLASIKKKWKNKGFAAGVNRELITKGATLLGEDLDYIIENTLQAMQEVHETLGL